MIHTHTPDPRRQRGRPWSCHRCLSLPSLPPSIDLAVEAYAWGRRDSTRRCRVDDKTGLAKVGCRAAASGTGVTCLSLWAAFVCDELFRRFTLPAFPASRGWMREVWREWRLLGASMSACCVGIAVVLNLMVRFVWPTFFFSSSPHNFFLR